MKTLVYIIALMIVFPVAAVFWLVSFGGRSQSAFAGFSQMMSLIPGRTGVFLRWAFYRWTIPTCGRDAHIGFGTVFSHRTVRIGRAVYIGSYCVVGDVDLEDDCILASAVSVCNGKRQHCFDRLDIPIREQGGEYVRITIGRDSWIGERAVVMADVGPQTIVGAGSVVTEALAGQVLAAGNPARIIGHRNS